VVVVSGFDGLFLVKPRLGVRAASPPGAGRRRQERVHDDQGGDLGGQRVRDRRKQEACAAVTGEDDRSVKIACGELHRLRDVVPVRGGSAGDGQQRRHHGDSAPALERVCDRPPARRSEERAVDEHERLLAPSGAHRRSMSRRDNDRLSRRAGRERPRSGR
jgi:hypothetical protein